MIINTLILDDEETSLDLMEDYVRQIPYLNLVGRFTKPMRALELLETKKIDLIYSDIQMPDLNGTDFLKSLINPPMFIFITADHNHALESYDLDVVDYITKPFSFARFLKASNKAKTLFAAKLENLVPKPKVKDFMSIRDGHASVIIRYPDIQYIEGEKEYVTISSPEKDYLIKRTLMSVIEELPSDRFMRVQKSYIINTDYVRKVHWDHLEMKGSIKDIPIGKIYREEVYKRFNIS